MESESGFSFAIASQPFYTQFCRKTTFVANLRTCVKFLGLNCGCVKNDKYQVWLTVGSVYILFKKIIFTELNLMRN